MIKKISSIGVSAMTFVMLSGALIMPVQAATVAELQAQINSLLASIQLLQAQLASAQGTPASTTFTKDLTLGSKGDEVTALQNLLISANKGAQAAALSAVGATGYFGNLTKAALAEYQAAAGVSPAAGYFGAKTRAYVASLAPGTPGVPVTPVTPVATQTQVTLASDSPTGSVIAGAGNMVVGKFVFSSLAAATVTELKLTKVGVTSDSNINNLYLADETGAVIAQYNSLSSGVATFSATKLFDVSAGATRTIALRMDLSSSASAGNNIAWQLTSATAAGVTFSGLPVSSNTLTVTSVTNPSLATITFDHQAVGATVDAGTMGVNVSNATVTVNNSAVSLKSIKYTVVGSVSMGDLKNAKLTVNGTQIGSTVASVGSDGTVVFDLSSANVKLPTGNTTLGVSVDVMGSPSRTMTWYILRPYDVYLIDSQYNTGIAGTFTDTYSTQVTIGTGSITVSLASDSPTGDIPVGASNVTLAKFTIYAAGEAVKVKFLDATITKVGDATWLTVGNITDDVSNVKIIDDAGNQVGNTISTVASGTTNGTCTLAADNIICHFGTSASAINYIVPANTTRVLSLKADIGSGADSTSLTGSLPGNTDNLEGQTSFTAASSGTRTGSTLTVVSSPLVAALNTAFGAPTYVAGANGKKIASFTLTASSAEGAKVSTLTFDKDLFDLDIQNLKIMVGSVQFGATKATVSQTAAETAMQFSGTSPITVVAGGSAIVDVYADLLSTATTDASAIDLTAWTATGLVSNSAITFSPTAGIAGQTVTISAAGATLTLSLDSATPSAKQVVMSQTNNDLFAINLAGNAYEDMKVSSVRILDTITGNIAGIASFENLKLYNGTTLLAGPMGATVVATGTSTVLFSLATPLVIPKNDDVTLTLKGDVASYDSGGSVSTTTHTWSIATVATDIVGIGKDSNTSATVGGSATSKVITVYATKLGFTSTLIGSATDRTRTATDNLATINWIASPAGNVVLGTVTVKFTGIAVSNGSDDFMVDLLKSDTTAFGGATQQTCDPAAGNTCSVTFRPDYTISKTVPQATILRVNSASFYDAASSNESLSVTINAVDDVRWSDGVNDNLPVEASVIPFTIANTQY